MRREEAVVPYRKNRRIRRSANVSRSQRRKQAQWRNQSHQQQRQNRHPYPRHAQPGRSPQAGKPARSRSRLPQPEPIPADLAFASSSSFPRPSSTPRPAVFLEPTNAGSTGLCQSSRILRSGARGRVLLTSPPLPWPVSDSAYGARNTPRSVTMAAIYFAGVTSNAGFQMPTPSGVTCLPAWCVTSFAAAAPQSESARPSPSPGQSSTTAPPHKTESHARCARIATL